MSTMIEMPAGTARERFGAGDPAACWAGASSTGGSPPWAASSSSTHSGGVHTTVSSSSWNGGF